ncbi:hypothetical protein [Micromonospora sp. NBC_00617]|uniref:hypothetical protein n=1 Tax=Micromonospora sp. NBC_00617 TaxID=2903587 RepID=UPI0030E046E7
MGTPLLRRFRSPVLGALALVLAVGFWADPADAAPEQEPGVTLRVYDVQVPLSEICTLKPAQTPTTPPGTPGTSRSRPAPTARAGPPGPR